MFLIWLVFYFLASVWKFGSYKTKEKEEDKTQKTTKMRRGTIEEKAEEKYDEIRLIRVETVVVCLRTSNIHLDAYSRVWGRKDACVIEVEALTNNFHWIRGGFNC